ncbi:hypothetical protein, partial [Yersinia proxima]|uniref:hypothetical protein n=1 Tax=Yersinia proxima TaxID=2890316 RepID=UPI0037D206CD
FIYTVITERLLISSLVGLHEINIRLSVHKKWLISIFARDFFVSLQQIIAMKIEYNHLKTTSYMINFV